MKWIGLTAYPFFMLFTFLTANGQHKSLAPLLDLKFEEVRRVESATDEFSIYYGNLADILKVLFSENELDYELLREGRSERISTIKEATFDDKWKQFLEAEIKLQWAFLDFRFGNDWDAFWGLRSSYRISRDLFEDHPDFQPNYRTRGVLNIIFGTVPSNRQWLMNLFSLKGDVFKGIEQLSALIGDKNFELESQLILSMTEIFLLENFAKGSNRISDLGSSGLLIQYVKALTYLKTHQAKEARIILSDIYEEAPVLLYFLAETFFQEHDFKTASELYGQFLKENEGTAYIKDAYLKMGIGAFYQNDLKTFQKELTLTAESGEDRTEIDRNALKLMRSIDAQDSVGLLIRFAIDGGFYERANELIAFQEKRELPPYYDLELTYRKARMAHLNGNPSEAISLYRQVIEQAGVISETYYAPNSFLQIGYLSRDAGDKTSARMYFERVLSFRNHPYKKSLDNKAKLALASLDRLDD